MSDLKSQIQVDKLPEHIAVIMDGNGRWAKNRNMPRVIGHKNGVNAVREVTEACAELGVKYLTLYAFSTENWNRPAFEVNALMSLLVETVRGELKTLNKNNIKLSAIGDLSKLPKATYNTLMEGIENTKNNNRMELVLALNYSAKHEILNATKALMHKAKDGTIADIDKLDYTDIDKELYTANIPDPELLIRTSGELRISNFMLWQIAYTELYFTDTFWPDFTKEELYKAVLDFQGRERRFGKTSDQVTL